MSSTNSAKGVPCTYDSCNKTFKTIEAVIQHKIKEPDHWYCKKCDEDFEEEESIFIHKIKSSKHVVCPMCGEEFKSEGGRDGHIRQFHRADQNVVCVGCSARFIRAAAYMTHIEKGQCQVISLDGFEEQRAKKQVLKEAFVTQLHHNAPRLVVPSEASSVGGVAVNLGSLLDDQKSPDEEWSKDPTAVHSPKRSSPSKTSTSSTEHWPKLGEGLTKTPDPNDLLAFSEMSVKDEQSSARKPRQASKLFPNAPKTPAGPEWASQGSPSRAATFSDVDLNASTKVTFDNERWDPFKFFDGILGKFTCPCGRNYDTVKGFETHLVSPAHAGGTARCPSCLRIFKTTSALVAHCESATTRCKINQSANYRQIMDEISGGVLETNGHLIDGSVRYEATQIDRW